MARGKRTLERTVMYSMGEKGQVVVHRFPWDANDPFQRKKLDNMVKRGFTFDDPRKQVSIPEVIVTEPQVSEAEITYKKSQPLMIPCPDCGKMVKGLWGLEKHQVVHQPGYKKKKYKKKVKK